MKKCRFLQYWIPLFCDTEDMPLQWRDMSVMASQLTHYWPLTGASPRDVGNLLICTIWRVGILKALAFCGISPPSGSVEVGANTHRNSPWPHLPNCPSESNNSLQLLMHFQIRHFSLNCQSRYRVSFIQLQLSPKILKINTHSSFMRLCL